MKSNIGDILFYGLLTVGCAAAILLLGKTLRERADRLQHVIDIHRDCEVLNTFMTSDGRRFYCAPWVEEPATPTPLTTDQETQA